MFPQGYLQELRALLQLAWPMVSSWGMGGGGGGLHGEEGSVSFVAFKS